MNILRLKWIWFGISGVIILPGIIAIALWGLKLGIDFTGGSLIEIKGTGDVAKVTEIVKQDGIESPIVTATGDESVLIRTKQISEDKHREVVKKMVEELKVEETRFETVGLLFRRFDQKHSTRLSLLLSL
jgi:preprotein translocase subunit SecF